MDGLLLAQGAGGSLSLGHIIDTIWAAIAGGAGGADYIVIMRNAALVLTTAMAILHFSRSAYRMALGETQHLVGDIVKFLAIYAVVGSWDGIAHTIYGLAAGVANGFATDFYNQVFQPMLSAYQQQMEAQRYLNLSSISGWMAAVGNLNNAGIYALSSVLCLVIIVAAMLYIMVSIVGVFVVLAFYLLIGPVFVALSMLQTFRQYLARWIGVTVSIFIVIPMYGIGLAICATFTGKLLASTLSLAHNPMEQLFGMCVVPILQASVILSVNKIVSQVTGGYFGSTGSLAAGIAAGAASIAAGAGASSSGGGGTAAGSAAGGAATGGAGLAATAAAGTASAAAGAASAAAQSAARG
ncbi:MAG TPA: type IV secretion system protein [Acidobacteriota bacterium]|nr:type IV secretion system protein [Acidobacteriota bacterium]HQO26653.1 type IV secretion system protein [Acidobacteriota bacterium]HQP75270.1 type IV secretion system protein [Acidobacteriota bacterium]